MPAKTCGGGNCSPRYQFLIDSLAPGKTRMGNHQLPPQIHLREAKKMLEQGISEISLRTDGGMTASWEFVGRHASFFKTGSVTFVGKREPGIW
jgi:hypothetical protein